MLNLLSEEDAQRLRQLFEQAEYTEPHLRKHLGAAELPSPRLRNQPRLLDRTSAQTPLNALLRWFWLALSQSAEEMSDLISEEFLRLLMESNLLLRHEGTLVPTAMVLPFQGFLVVSDHPSAILNKRSEMVLWPNPTSRFLSRFAIRRPSRATLDLGTGSGILSLGVAEFSETVVATDLNARAAQCARFNALLNGIRNIEVLEGDCFAPVGERRFDLILSNPPFFITPQSDFLFCDNSMELDGLCRKLVKEAPAHLNENGYMEMLCEWAQIKGQPWEERLAEWISNTGCDAWVMKGLTQDPEEYAQHRISETEEDPSKDATNYRNYMDYYRRQGVEAIHDGLVILRRREGNNFIRIEEVPSNPSGDLGSLILNTFAAHDLMRDLDTDEKLLGMQPCLAPAARLQQICRPSKEGWSAESLVLRLTSGFPFQIDVQPLVADFLGQCDGTKTARQAIEEFASKAKTPIEHLQSECLGMIRKLIERGFMVAI